MKTEMTDEQKMNAMKNVVVRYTLKGISWYGKSTARLVVEDYERRTKMVKIKSNLESKIPMWWDCGDYRKPLFFSRRENKEVGIFDDLTMVLPNGTFGKEAEMG